MMIKVITDVDMWYHITGMCNFVSSVCAYACYQSISTFLENLVYDVCMHRYISMMHVCGAMHSCVCVLHKYKICAHVLLCKSRNVGFSRS
jgi:hypothetical protein